MSVRGPWDLGSPQGFGKHLRDTSLSANGEAGFTKIWALMRDWAERKQYSGEQWQKFGIRDPMIAIFNSSCNSTLKKEKKITNSCVKDAYLRARQKNSRTLLFFPFFDNFLTNHWIVDYFHEKSISCVEFNEDWDNHKIVSGPLCNIALQMLILNVLFAVLSS